MKISITSALSMIFLTFVCVLFINVMSAQMQIAKLNDFHYGVVHELESSDFSPAVIDQLTHAANYDVRIENRGVKDDLRIYQVITSGAFSLRKNICEGEQCTLINLLYLRKSSFRYDTI